ncbi:MAG TPA: hypothetical protein PLJ37_00815 [Chitinophagales bacterium]|nr:hypothetical protein [Chitinophagales bacterium]HMW93493.1 hypothetical protein [Chitinophagales bacterium]HMZ92884.1 hypothetical protein [Chitinophagales bacterium]HNG25927.1 hypothetical protein [Chitinophagales bacterium]
MGNQYSIGDKAMTKNQIEKRLKKLNIYFEENEIKVERDKIEVCIGYYEKNGYGYCDENLTQEMAEEINKTFNWDIKVKQYGAWVLQPKIEDNGDWNDKGSKWHY